MSEQRKTGTKLDPAIWVDEYGDYLYNYAWSRVHSKQLAEDLVQDTFVSALNAMDSFRGESTVRTWMLSILRRKVVDHYRKKSTQNEKTTLSFESPFEDESGTKGHWIMERAPKDWQWQSGYPMRSKEFQSIMESCLSQLPEKWKSVFVLKVMEEIESSEICKEVGCTSSNFWVILHRARLQLRECIEKKWINE
ncbi:MAG: sigma-70 family RNA polymerase sigma factor [Bacteroidales bacterium]|nr:sigma-70 family RNA polymerase sigma factor [Bacteroidales bacterium]